MYVSLPDGLQLTNACFVIVDIQRVPRPACAVISSSVVYTPLLTTMNIARAFVMICEKYVRYNMVILV